MGFMEKPYVKVITYALILTLSLFIAKLIDVKAIHLEICTLIVKIIAIFVMIAYIKKNEIKVINKCDPKYYAFISLPAILVLILKFNGFSRHVHFGIFMLGFLQVIASVIVAELLYRAINTHLLAPNGYNVKNIVIVTAVYTLSFIFDAFFIGLEASIIQLITVCAFSLFLLGLYVRTDNIVVPTLAHFAFSAMMWLCGTPYASKGGIGRVSYVFIYTLMIVLYTVCGVIMLRKEAKETIN